MTESEIRMLAALRALELEKALLESELRIAEQKMVNNDEWFKEHVMLVKEIRNLTKRFRSEI